MIPSAALSQPAAVRWSALFLSHLPTIQRCALFAFRHLPAEERDEAVQGALANACAACARLVARGCAERVFPTALARFAVAQVRGGRSVGTSINGGDVLSPCARRNHRWVVDRLDDHDPHAGHWLDTLVHDRRTPIPDQVQFRIDFSEWLTTLSARDRQIAELLAAGHTTFEVARQFSISPSRVSQLRRQFHGSWERLQTVSAPVSAAVRPSKEYHHAHVRLRS